VSNKTTNWLLVVIICILLTPFAFCGGCLWLGMSVDTEAIIEELEADQAAEGGR
jgi:quinol-cytochrome oxidoreductase complex cytochrome b subunit